MDLEEIADRIRECQRCGLAKTRKNAVPGEGPSSARIVLVGEAPGAREDQEGKPFVGAAGKFLDQLLGLAGLNRAGVFITNVVKCRPPGNRDPTPDEIGACREWLELQIQTINPKIIVTLGRFSLGWFQRKYSLTAKPISRLHGKPIRIDNLLWHGWLVPMYHPAAGLYRGWVKEQIIEDWRRFGDFLVSLNEKA